MWIVELDYSMRRETWNLQYSVLIYLDQLDQFFSRHGSHYMTHKSVNVHSLAVTGLDSLLGNLRTLVDRATV